MTWDEANQACRTEGGYLATITSPEERQIITDLIESESKTDSLFYVGFQGYQWVDGVFQNEGWIENNGERVSGHCLTNFIYWSYPGYEEIKKEWDFAYNQIGIMKYSDETRQIYRFEAPKDLLSVASQYAGRIGYICEYG